MPQNIKVLIIATPRVELLKGEVEKIKRYLDTGGNLFWLIDQEPLRGLQPLAEFLGLQLTPGVVVDPASARAAHSAHNCAWRFLWHPSNHRELHPQYCVPVRTPDRNQTGEQRLARHAVGRGRSARMGGDRKFRQRSAVRQGQRGAWTGRR